MSLIDTPKPPPAPGNARTVTSLTDEDVAPQVRASGKSPKTKRRVTTQRESDALRARITDALLTHGPATASEIAHYTGDHIVNVYSALREMRTAKGAHIARVGLPLTYGPGPSPAGEELDIAHLPGDTARQVLLLLRAGPSTSRELRTHMLGTKHWQAIKDLLNRDFLAREGAAPNYLYSLTAAGRKLADYVAKLEEHYRWK